MGELTIAETISLWQLVVTAGIGLLQCALIWVGLRQMRIASAERNRQLDNQEAAATARHAENMRALEAMIDGLKDVSAGLRTVIERTSDKAGTA